MASRAPTIPQDARNEPVPPPPTLNTGFPPNQPPNQPHRRRAASPTAVNNITAGIPAQNDHLNLPVPGGLNNQLVVGGLSNLPNRLVAGGLNNHPHQPVAGSLHLPNFPVPEGLNNLPHGRNNIRHIAEYFEDIMETLYNTQGVLLDYMVNQPTISPSMRSILINWIAEVIAEFNLATETNYLAITIMDKYLQDNEIPRDQLQLLGITCLLIASKVEDVNTPTVKDLAEICDNTYSAVQILKTERIVLDKLQYGFCIPTEGGFIPIYIQLVKEYLNIDPSSQIYMDFVELTNYICEMSKLCYHTITFLPSIVASASAYIALHTTKIRYPNIDFTEQIVNLFRINATNRGTFCHCVTTIQNYLFNYPENLRAIPDKYQRVINFDMPMGNLFPPNART